MRTLVTSGTIVTASQVTRADLLIEDDRIVEIGPSIMAVPDRILDASGRLVLPGGVDVHTHLDMPLGEITSGLYPRKGTIAAGSDADLVILDPHRSARISAATHHMRVDYNPYEGREVTGIVETVLSRGRTIVEHGRFVGRAGAGAFLRRRPRET